MKTAKQALIDGVLNANNPFVESISYTPSGGEATTINATVNRTSGMIRRQNIDGRPRYDAEIIISNDSTYGISTVTPKEDIVTMAAPELNSTSHTFNVIAIIGKSSMGWHLGLQQ
jgi:hypothetical protein